MCGGIRRLVPTDDPEPVPDREPIHYPSEQILIGGYILLYHPREYFNYDILGYMPYKPDEATLIISKYHRDLLKSIARKERRPMKATLELLIEQAVTKSIN